MTVSQVISIVRSIIAPLERRVRITAIRALLKLVNDSGPCQTVQAVLLDPDDPQDGIERFGEYGFGSVPDEGAEGIALCISGSKAHAVIIATEDRRSRPTGQQKGEVFLWTKQNGVRVLCKQDGTVLIGTNPTAFVALADKVNTELGKIASAFSSFVPGTGGASFTAAYTSAGDVSAEEMKAK